VPMEARCPRCSNVFTTDRSGIQFCPHCGQQIDVPAPPGGGWGAAGGPGAGRFSGEPPPGGTPGHLPGGKDLTPWERRRELGLVKGFFETWRLTITAPQTFFPTVRPDVPWTEALFWAWIIHAINVVLSLPLLALGMSSLMLPQNLPSNPNIPPEQMAAVMKIVGSAFGIGPLLGSLILYPLFAIIGAALMHLVAMIIGAGKNGWGATMRAFCYGSGPYVLSFIPCVGFLAFLYVQVLRVFGMMGIQETDGFKATMTVLLPWVLLCCCGVAAAIGFGGLIAGLAGAASGSRSF